MFETVRLRFLRFLLEIQAEASRWSRAERVTAFVILLLMVGLLGTGAWILLAHGPPPSSQPTAKTQWVKTVIGAAYLVLIVGSLVAIVGMVAFALWSTRHVGGPSASPAPGVAEVDQLQENHSTERKTHQSKEPTSL